MIPNSYHLHQACLLNSMLEIDFNLGHSFACVPVGCVVEIYLSPLMLKTTVQWMNKKYLKKFKKKKKKI